MTFSEVDGRTRLLRVSDVAIVTIDLQNGFCDPAGSLARLGMDVRPLRRAVSACHDLATAARELGVPVIFTALRYRSDYADAPLAFRELQSSLCGIGGLTRGSWDAELVDGLAAPGELVVDKQRTDAFLATDLDAELRRRGIENIAFCGVTTSVCVSGTARAASDRGYRAFIVADATADLDPVAHEVALATFATAFGHPISSTALLGELASAEASERSGLT